MNASNLDEYEERSRLLTSLAPQLEANVNDLLRSIELRVHAVSSRVKDRESLERKLLRPDLAGLRLRDLTDFLGLRVVTYFSDEVDRVASALRAAYLIDDTRSVDKRLALDPDQFGYLSLHFAAGFRPEQPLYPHYPDVRFEIQIRTILQHAWAEIEHDRGYKSDTALPREFRRRFSRVAGMLEAADDEFLRLRTGLTEYQSTVDATAAPAVVELAIDQISLSKFVRTNEVARGLDLSIAESAAAELRSVDRYIGRRAADLVRQGFKTIGDVEVRLAGCRELLQSLAEAWLADASHDALSEGVSLFYLAILVASESPSPTALEDHFRANDIGDERARQLAQNTRELLVRLTEA